jgi:hypothetical protein
MSLTRMEGVTNNVYQYMKFCLEKFYHVVLNQTMLISFLFINYVLNLTLKLLIVSFYKLL